YAFRPYIPRSSVVCGIARPTDEMNPRDSLLHWRQRRKRGVRLRLIPIRNRGIVIGTVVRVAVFDGGPERLRERNRRIQMEAIDRRARAGKLRSHNRRAKRGVRKRAPAKIPRA